MHTNNWAHPRILLFTLVVLLIGSNAHAQQIDLSLHATAVPDSFEVRATSTGPVFDLLPSAVLTLRWEQASGGVANNSDVRRSCGAYTFLNYGGTVDIGPYRYFTLVIMADRNLSASGCAITTAGMSLGGVRIRELSGCRNVALVQNAYTGLNNLDYFFSIGGTDVTGVITSGPLSTGDCPPCEPPVITNTTAAPIPYCGVGVDLAVTATGSISDHAWYKPNGAYLGWLPHVVAPTQPAGLYTVVVSNACGADTAQVEASVDPDLCEPPVIDSVWYHQEGANGVRVRAVVDEPCITVKWIMPWGAVVPANNLHTALVNNAPPGLYTAVVQNACGSDTMALDLVPPVPCTPATISSATITSQGACATGTAHFAAIVTGPAPILSQGWFAPNGAQLTAVPNFNMGFAPWGLYTFVATNLCGADTVRVFHGGADTTGLADCVPPEIMSVGPNGHACYHDEVRLFASYVNDGPCAQTNWSGINLLSTNGDTITGTPTDLSIRFTATNACGQVSMQVPITIWYPDQLVHRLCQPVTTPLSLDSMMHEDEPYNGGQWFHDGVPVGAYYDPAIDTSGTYYYHMEVDTNVNCPVVQLIIVELSPAYAGEDTTVYVCSTDPPFAMIDMLGGEPMPGGTWTFWGVGANPVFDPATGTPGTYRYRKIVGSLITACTDYAYLGINVEGSLPWYADTDGDGLGDPLDSLLSCELLEGYVANGDDACPQLFGTVGDPCDDGDPETSGDVITADCACIGGMGLEEAGAAGGWQLWPNPARGVVQLQGPSDTGTAHITVVDASGREVLHASPAAATKPITLHTERLAPGTYSVRIRTTERTAVLRLVVR